MAADKEGNVTFLNYEATGMRIFLMDTRSYVVSNVFDYGLPSSNDYTIDWQRDEVRGRLIWHQSSHLCLRSMR